MESMTVTVQQTPAAKHEALTISRSSAGVSQSSIMDYALFALFIQSFIMQTRIIAVKILYEN